MPDWFDQQLAQQKSQSSGDWFDQQLSQAGQPTPTPQPTAETGHPWLAAAARGLAGMLSGAVSGTELLGVTAPASMAAGAGISGLGETVAEALEQGTMHPNIDPARVGAASAVGAVPFGTYFKAGAPLFSTIRGAVMGGGAPALEDVLAGRPVDLQRVAMGAGIGGATGGVSAKAFGGLADPIARAKLAAERATESATTAAPAAERAVTGPSSYEIQLSNQRYKGDVPSSTARTIKGTGESLVPPVTPQTPSEFLQEQLDRPTPGGYPTPIIGAGGEFEPYRPGAVRAEREARQEAIRQALAEAKRKEQEAAQQRIQNEITRLGMQPKEPPSISEDVGTGLLRGTTRYVVPKAGKSIGKDLEEFLSGGGGGGETAAQEFGAVTEPQTTVTQPGELTTPQTAPAPTPASEWPPRPVAERGGPPTDPAGIAQLQQLERELAEGPDKSYWLTREGARDAGEIPVPGQAEGGAPKAAGEAQVAAPGPEVPAPSTTGQTIVPPEPEAPSVFPEGPEPQPMSDKEQWVVEQALKLPPDQRSAWVKAMSEKGEISPGMMQLLSRLGWIGGGAAIGAPVGAYYNPDDPMGGAARGAIGGGLLGAWLSPNLKEPQPFFERLLDLHRASLLASAGPQLKKMIGDPAGLFWRGARETMSGDPGRVAFGKALMKEAGSFYANPEVYGDFMRTIRGGQESPGLMGMIQDIRKESATGAGTEAAGGLKGTGGTLGAVTIPFQGWWGATKGAVERAYEAAGYPAGINPMEVLQETTGTATPPSQIGKEFLGFLQRNPAAKWLVPFSKLPINIGEGVRNIPGVAQSMGLPDAAARSKIGALQALLGGGFQYYKQQQEEAGDPVSPLVSGLAATSMGIPGVVPHIAGRLLTSLLTGGKGGFREAGQLIPGSRSLTMPFPGETDQEFIQRLLKSGTAEVLPGWMTPDPGTAR